MKTNLQAREDGTYHGSSFVSDESPPSANRYTGLRFQITQVYTLWFDDVATWESPQYNEAYPFKRERRLQDIMNVPLKTGSATLEVICQQTSRQGVHITDYNSAAGDGGGENEGEFGVHSLISAANEEYVHKRCMPHFSWRTFAAGEKEMTPHTKLGEALNRYLRRGVTWQRLRSYAVMQPAAGGIGLFSDGSVEFNNFFKTAPPRLIDERPEATYDWVHWLIIRQTDNYLARLVAHDLTMRTLQGTDNRHGLQTLQSRRDNIMRNIDVVLMHKSLHLFHKIKKQHFVAIDQSFDDLMKGAITNVTSTRLTDDVLHALHLTRDEVVALGIDHDDETSHPWIEVAVLLVSGVELSDLDLILPDAMEYHKKG